MMRISRILKSDFMKLKRTPVLILHILIPGIGICACSAYSAISTADTVSKTEGYFQALGLAFPTVISIVCAMIAEQEFMAGNGYNLLVSASPKILNCVSKILLLSVLGLFSTILAACGFGIIGNLILKQNVFSMGFYFKAACIIFSSNIALYMLHLFISLRFGKGASIGLGVAESLVSALMVTGLGSGIWYFIPCAWSTRFSTTWTAISADKSVFTFYRPEMTFGIIVSATITFLALFLLMVWFWRWEGRKTYD